MATNTYAQPSSMNYCVAFGANSSANPSGIIYQTRAPTSADTSYPIGTQWIYVGVASYDLLGLTSANNVLQQLGQLLKDQLLQQLKLVLFS